VVTTALHDIVTSTKEIESRTEAGRLISKRGAAALVEVDECIAICACSRTAADIHELCLKMKLSCGLPGLSTVLWHSAAYGMPSIGKTYLEHKETCIPGDV
jgi:hypothetical protein